MIKSKSKRIIQKGAALIISLLVISAVTGIVFYSSRLAIKEIIIMSKMENSMNAYYAAEAGVEQALLMWRHNHNVEYSADCQSPSNCAGAPTESTGQPVEVSMDSDRNYKLKIWHRNVGSLETGTLDKDESVEYDLTEIESLDITCNSDCDYDANTYKFALEYYVITNNNEVGDKDMLYFGGPLTKPIDLTNAKTLRIRSWGDTKTYTLSSGEAKLDSRYTTIESTGQFGDTQRKLQVKINRTSGKVFSIFDFVLFGGTEINVQ